MYVYHGIVPTLLFNFISICKGKVQKVRKGERWLLVDVRLSMLVYFVSEMEEVRGFTLITRNMDDYRLGTRIAITLIRFNPTYLFIPQKTACAPKILQIHWCPFLTFQYSFTLVNLKKLIPYKYDMHFCTTIWNLGERLVF